MLSASALGSLIYNKRLSVIQANLGKIEDSGTLSSIKRELEADSKAIAEAVISHIKEKMQIQISPADVSVLPGIPVATAGLPSAQTGATTGPGKAQGMTSPGSVK